MKGLLWLTLSSLLCWVSDRAGRNTYCIGSSPPYPLVWLSPSHCHSCYKVSVLGCVDQHCHLKPGHKCLTINVYLRKMWVFSNLRCGTTEKACDTFTQSNSKLCLTCNTTCYDKDKCNSPALGPTPALALVLLTSLAGLGLCLLH
ncbi:LOW QUALITY PROTEIN: lymphocyte antigen 6 complex locus protein G6c [Glossophaga mutica]